MVKLLHKLYTKHRKGFTLFEVLVVVVIMSVLAVIAIPTYNKIIRKSRVADGLNVLNMLAGAQNKYFIEHGHYAQSLTSLNAPLKEYRVLNSNDPYTDIVTTNFTYDKVFTQHCIRATANIGGRYTLIKNYKTKDKVVCLGRGCRDISDFVDEITNDDYPFLCPNEIECTLNQQQCGAEHFFEDTCACACLETDYQNCIADGGIFVQPTCSCAHWGNNGNCDEEGEIIAGAYTGESCNYTGAIPEYANHTPGGSYGGTSQSKGHEPERGIDPGSLPPPQVYVCGMKYAQKVCRDRVWTDETICVYKGLYCREQGKILDLVTCDCITPCDPNNKPVCSASGYAICDPCPNDPDIPSIIEQMLQGNSGNGTCYHCGYIPSTADEPTCDTQTGQWHCHGAQSGTCTEISPDYIEPYKDCNGKNIPGANPSIISSNTCGQKSLSNIRCWQEVTGGAPNLDPIYSNTCTLKQGHECFTGDSRECVLPNGSQGIEVCVDCNWDNNCVPTGCVAPNACTPGETRPCTLPDGSQGTQTCDENCTWDECSGGCNPAEKPTGYGYQACHTKNGVTDPDLYCGWQKTNKSICVEGQWQWDFTDIPCQGYNGGDPQEYPESNIECSGGGWQAHCGIKRVVYICSSANGTEYYWNLPPGPIQYTECKPRPGANCGWPGLTGDLGNGKFCSESCIIAKCNYPYSLYNRYQNVCYEQKYGKAVLTVVRSNTNPSQTSPASSYDTGTPERYQSCETNETSFQNCARVCRYPQEPINVNYQTSLEPEEYCESRQGSAIKVIDDGPTRTNTRYCAATNSWVWEQYGNVHGTVWCKKVNPIPTSL